MRVARQSRFHRIPSSDIPPSTRFSVSPSSQPQETLMSTIDYSDKIPNNVSLSEDRTL